MKIPDIGAKIKGWWNGLVTWLETANLVLFMVLVSAVHYAVVLAGKDIWPVAISIGLLVDLGHYRTVRAAVTCGRKKTWVRVARIIIAVAMTAVSLAYHERYYQDLWLSIPLPGLIAALAWLEQVEPDVKEKETKAPAPAIEQAKAPAKASAVFASSGMQVAIEHEQAYVCATCGYKAKSPKALSGHQKKHRKEKQA